MPFRALILQISLDCLRVMAHVGPLKELSLRNWSLKYPCTIVFVLQMSNKRFTHAFLLHSTPALRLMGDCRKLSLLVERPVWL
jgi:hypothetical protein